MPLVPGLGKQKQAEFENRSSSRTDRATKRKCQKKNKTKKRTKIILQFLFPWHYLLEVNMKPGAVVILKARNLVVSKIY